MAASTSGGRADGRTPSCGLRSDAGRLGRLPALVSASRNTRRESGSIPSSGGRWASVASTLPDLAPRCQVDLDPRHADGGGIRGRHALVRRRGRRRSRRALSPRHRRRGVQPDECPRRESARAGARSRSRPDAPAHVILAARRGKATLADAIARGAVKVEGSKRAPSHFQDVFRLSWVLPASGACCSLVYE